MQNLFATICNTEILILLLLYTVQPRLHKLHIYIIRAKRVHVAQVNAIPTYDYIHILH